MRLLHTSDWHLGQTLYDFDRSFEHQRFLDWLLATLKAEQPDALLIAGDVFDNSNPSASAQHQLYRFLTAARVQVPHLSIVMVAGNHDSPGRLEATAPFLTLFEAAVVGHIQRRADHSIDLERLVVPLRDAQGKVAAWCLAIPFLRPGDVPRVERAADPYLEGVAELYRQALAVALARREPGQAIIAMGHCHMVGGQVSETSERHIVIGGAEALSAGMFDPAIVYAALGHLHLPQAVGGNAHIRYSGSPLPMSFAEVDYRHQVLRIELDGEAVTEIQPIPIPRAVQLLRVPKKPAPIEEVLAALAALDLPDRPEQEQPYLEVRVRLDAPEPGLRTRVEAALAGKALRLARIEPTSARSGADQDEPAALSLSDLERLAPESIFVRLCEQKIGAETPERVTLLAELNAAFAELANAPAQEAAA